MPRSKLYPSDTLTDVDYANDLALHVNTSAQCHYSQVHFDPEWLYLICKKTS